jgi:hypothetical protein
VEVIAALSLATDLGLGIDLEHGLRSTLFAVRLCERLGVDRETAPSLSTSGETLTIEESMTLRARTEQRRDVGHEHGWSWSSG